MSRRSILEIYNSNVDWFYKNRTLNLMEKKYLDAVVSEIPTNGKILDIGSGTGQPIAQYFYEKGFSVTGVDGAANMVQQARHTLPHANWIVADMRTLELNEKFDAVLAWDSFFHLTNDDQRKMFAVFSVHLKPEGVLLFTSGHEEGEAIGEMNGDTLYHSSLSTNEYHQILKHYGFIVLNHQVQDPDCGLHTVWFAKKIN